MKRFLLLILSFLCVASANAGMEAKPLTAEQAKASFSLDYLDFVNVWMKEDVLRKVGDILALHWGTSVESLVRTFYNNPSHASDTLENSAVDTFEQYCAFHNGTSTKLRQEIFCANGNTPIAHMKWTYKSKDKGDPVDEISFTHEVGNSAKLSLDKKKQIKPGAEISTKYGRGLVIETKDGGLINFQPRNGQPRWITTDDVLNW